MEKPQGQPLESMDKVSDNRAGSFAEEATQRLQRAGFPCRVDASGGQLGVFASRSVKAGELIAVERPLALTVNRAVLVHTCAVCLADSRDAAAGPQARWKLQCERCHSHFFCSEACEAAGLARHRGVECEALSGLGEADDDDLKDQVAQAVRILADRDAGRTVDAGPAGVMSYASYAERLVGVPPCTQESRASLAAAVATTLRCVPERARVSASELVEQPALLLSEDTAMPRLVAAPRAQGHSYATRSAAAADGAPLPSPQQTLCGLRTRRGSHACAQDENPRAHRRASYTT